ncbi:ArnT family glycosyltransferase [Candidatus Omnitrophota bacterium]
MTRNKFVIFLVLYCALHILLRLLVSDSLQTDEAEMVLYFQQPLSLGYSSQPPLYTWLQVSFFKLFGLNIFSLTLLKNSLCFIFYFFLYLCARQVFKRHIFAVFSVVSLFPVYNFSWLLHEDLTHSVLLLALCALSFYLFLRLVFSRKIVYYPLFGLAAGLGMLAKYNYAVFIVALLLAALCISSFRKAILDRRIIFALAPFCALILPHLAWCLENGGRLMQDAIKFNIGTKGSFTFFLGLNQLSKAVIFFLLPLIAVYLPCFFQAIKKVTLSTLSKSGISRFLWLFFVWALAISAATVIFTNAGRVKARWLQPVFFLAPLYFFTLIKDANDHFLRRRLFLSLCIAFALIVTFSVPGRIVFATSRGKYNRLNFPYAELSRTIRQNGFERGMIFAENHVMGADLKLYFKDSAVVVPDQRFIPPPSEEFTLALIVRNIKDDPAYRTRPLTKMARERGFKRRRHKKTSAKALYRFSSDSYYEITWKIMVKKLQKGKT